MTWIRLVSTNKNQDQPSVYHLTFSLLLCHACVLALDTVFTRALETFGSSGPDTCHPFAHRYDVVDAVFIEEVPHPQADPSLGLKISKFTITDPNNPDVHTGATVDNSSILPSNLQQGDVLRLEVVSSFPTKATLTTPFAIGFMKPLDRKRSVVIIDMRVLGFVESRGIRLIGFLNTCRKNFY